AVTYTVRDGEGDTVTSTLLITVTAPINIPPIAADDTFSVNENGAVSGNVITHDDGDGVIDTHGEDGNTLSITHINGLVLNFISADSNYATVNVEGGTLRINAQGDFTYTKTGGFAYEADTVDTNPKFVYTLSDGATENSMDTGQVTIKVIDSAPIANADNNYVNLSYEREAETTEKYVVGGGVLFEAGSSSGDAPDSSEDGQFTLISVSYIDHKGDKIEYFFDVNGSLKIETVYGTLLIATTGLYTYTVEAGMAIPETDFTNVFEYTIQDSDVNSPETASNTLTINFDVREPASAPNPFTVTDDNGDVFFSKVGTTIDTFIQQAHENSGVSAELPLFNDKSVLDLSDLVSEEHADSLENYLAFNGDEAATPELSETANATLMEKEIVLGDVDGEEYQNITNGLLANGGTIVSDETAPVTAALVEMDSSELV
ncbi:MAG: Ig-like domain-containing protein, partial [Alteromonadaceae bacterium]